jgi:SnoaL-like polyketide cyclase
MSRTHLFTGAVVCLVLSTALTGCANKEQAAELAAMKAQEVSEQANLANFDDLDFNVFTNQKWDELSRSHSQDITVHWPDGHTTQGIEKHIEDLKGMFVWAPDTRIKEHPVKFGQGEWTAVIGTMEGTFTQPMPIGEGKTIPPTGKPFKLQMATIGHWTSQGVMDAEYLFWDNQEFMKQIGLGK